MVRRRAQLLVAAPIAALLTAGMMSCDSDSTPPDECDADPLDSAACGRALDARCREQTTREDCESQGPFKFDRNIEYACNWARRATFADLASCTVNEPDQVCVAVIQDPEFKCVDGCIGDTDSFNTFEASNSADEVLILRCPESGASVSGPVDASILIQDDSFSYLTCSSGVLPQARPELCACREQVCDAVEGL